MSTIVAGFEHGTDSGVAAGAAAERYFDINVGSASYSTTSPRTGSHSLEIALTGANTRGWTTTHLGSTQTVLVGSFYFYISTDPSAATIFAYIGSAAGADSIGLEYYPSSDQVHLFDVATSSGQFSTTTVVPGQWYLLDFRLNVSANPWVFDWQIDGTAQTQFSPARASSTISTWRFGNPFTSFTGTFRYDDAVFSTTSGDYPFGAHTVQLLTPSGVTASDGGTDFRTFTGNGGTLTAWDDATALANIDELPPTISASADGICQITTDTTNHMVINMNTFTIGSETVLGCRMVACGWAASTTAATISFRTATSTLYATADPAFDNSTTAPAWMCKMVPLTEVDTQSELDALEFRVGYSGDAAPDIGIHSLHAELAVTESAGTEAPAESIALTVTANSPSKDIKTGSQGISTTVVANNPSPSIRASAECALVSVVANGTTSDIKSTPSTATVTVASNAPDKNVTTEVALVTVTANSTTSLVSPTPLTSVVTVIGNDASPSIRVPAGSASVTVAAETPTITVGTNVFPEVANVTVTANGTTSSVSTGSQSASVTVVGNDATVSTTGNKDVFPGCALVSVASNEPSPSIGVNATLATISTLANGTSSLVSPGAAYAAITVLANTSTSRVATTPQTAPVNVIANQPIINTGGNTFVNAECALVSVTANSTTSTIKSMTQVATVIVDTFSSSNSVRVNSDISVVSVSSDSPTAVPNTRASAEVAIVTVSCNQPAITSHTFAFPQCAVVNVLGFQPVAQTVIPIADLIIKRRLDSTTIIKRDDIITVARTVDRVTVPGG